MAELCCAVVIRRSPNLSFSLATVERHDPPHVSVDFLHQHVETQMLECLSISHDGIEIATLWMDEEGKLRSKQVSALMRFTEEGRRAGPVADALAGNLVITGPTDQEGDTLLLPEHVAVQLCDVLNEGSGVAITNTLHMLVTSLPTIVSK
jgi:hypothetical protein